MTVHHQGSRLLPQTPSQLTTQALVRTAAHTAVPVTDPSSSATRERERDRIYRSRPVPPCKCTTNALSLAVCKLGTACQQRGHAQATTSAAGMARQVLKSSQQLRRAGCSCYRHEHQRALRKLTAARTTTRPGQHMPARWHVTQPTCMCTHRGKGQRKQATAAKRATWGN